MATSRSNNSTKEFARDLERLKQNPAVIVSQRSEALPQEAKFSKNGFTNIRDTDWEGVDPLAMRDKIKTMEIVMLKQDLTFFSRLSNAALIPFAVPFPELCFKVGQLW